MNTHTNTHLQMLKNRIKELNTYYWIYTYQDIHRDIPALREAIKRKTYLNLPSSAHGDDCE